MKNRMKAMRRLCSSPTGVRSKFGMLLRTRAVLALTILATMTVANL